MCPPLSLEQAAELYSHVLDDVLAATIEVASGLELEPVLAVHPGEATMELRARAPSGFRIVSQRGRDLAERMGWAASEAVAGGAQRLLLRGSDSPTLAGDTLAALLDCLDGPSDAPDVVACPDRDGGYSLIGMRRAWPGLFDHAMSTDSVLSDTFANARRLGLRTDQMGESFDLDTAGDLDLLAHARACGDTTLCPRTLAYLDENDLWPAAR